MSDRNDEAEDPTADAWQPAFLAALRASKSTGGACEEARITRRRANAFRESDPVFRSDWDDARQDGIDRLEDQATHLALEGSRSVETRTEADGTTRIVRTTYDGALLRFMLKRVRPDPQGAGPRGRSVERADLIGDDPDPPTIDRGTDR